MIPMLACLGPLALAGALAVVPVANEAGAPPAHVVRVADVNGLPPDSTLRAEFVAGFDGALAAPTYPLEGAAPGATGPNRFVRAAAAEDGGDAPYWTLVVTVRMPPPYSAIRSGKSGRGVVHTDPKLRAARGMTVAVTVQSPEDVRTSTVPAAEVRSIVFPQSIAPAQVLAEVPQGFRFPWDEAGRAAARVALEVLHHRSGDLAEQARIDLSPASRVKAVR